MIFVLVVEEFFGLGLRPLGFLHNAQSATATPVDKRATEALPNFRNVYR